MEQVEDAQTIARTEALFREVNERIAESAERFEASEAEFVCECGDPHCTTRIEASLDEYEEVRESATTFLLVPGHEDARIEAVVERQAGRAVVRKRHPDAVEVVERLDPRAAA
jgi:hypothetical protein